MQVSVQAREETRLGEWGKATVWRLLSEGTRPFTGEKAGSARLKHSPLLTELFVIGFVPNSQLLFHFHLSHVLLL